MSVFKIYSSSAGSGKTFTLTKEYLKLILREEDKSYFKKILAITFTNDAAKEMKVRIVNALKDFSEKKVTILFQTICQELPDITSEKICERANLIFLEILHNYSDFAVKTIDAFVNQVVSSFTFDLNLPYNYEIVLDPVESLNEAVGRILNKVGNVGHEKLSQLISDFALSKIEEEKSWNDLGSELVNFAKALTRSDERFYIDKNIDLSDEDFRKIKENIRKYKTQIEKEISDLAKTAIALIELQELKIEDFSYGKSGVMGFFNKLVGNPELMLKDAEISLTRAIDAFENNAWYKKSQETYIKNSIDEITIALTEIGYKILSYQEQRAKYITLSNIEKNLNKIPLLQYIKIELEEMMRLRNEVFLADFNQWILNIVRDEPVPFIYERIGEKYQHLLIDEFQDTSNSQFYNLLPLLENALSGGNYNMIVGDPKQSIYSWRGGNVDLMLDLINNNADSLKLNRETSENQFHQIDAILNATEVENLGINYRSKKEIVSFNNDFFKFISDKASQKYPKLALVLSDLFQQSPENSPAGGHVEIDFVVNENDNILQRVVEFIHREIGNGFEYKDIAILCRKNDESAMIANYLENLGFEVKSADSLKLNNNIEVKFLISLLTYIHNPTDVFNKFEVISFYKIITNQALNSQENNETVFEKIDFDLIENRDYYTVLEYFIDVFELKLRSQSLAYIFTFQDILLEFYQKKSKSLDEFLAYWEKKKDAFTIQNTDSNAITITSVHKSKGLEYPVVIMPYTHWTLEPNKYAVSWHSLENLDYPELQVNQNRLNAAPFSISSNMLLTELADPQQKYLDVTFIEGINMFYVASTRASERLIMMVPQSVKEDNKGIAKLNIKRNSVAEWVVEYLTHVNLYTENRSNYILSQGEFFIQKENKDENENSKFKMEDIPFKIADTKLKIRNDNGFVNLETSSKRTIGNLVHAAFEEIKTVDDIERTLIKIKNHYFGDDFDLLDKQIWAVVNHPELQELFIKGNQVYNEIEILGKNIGIQRPDRIVMKGDTVFIVDYKTGEKSEKHKRQIKMYGDLLRQMDYQNIKLKIVYLEPLEVVNVDFD